MMSSSAKADDPVTTGRAVFPLHSRCILDAPPSRGMTEELGQRNRKLLYLMAAPTIRCSIDRQPCESSPNSAMPTTQWRDLDFSFGNVRRFTLKHRCSR